MPVRFACPSCKSPCLVDERHLGLTVRCQQCQKTFIAGKPSKEVVQGNGGIVQEPCRLDIGCATSPGRVRKRNEDSLLVWQQTWASMGERQDMALVVVADGMGGYEAGDHASQLAIRTLGSSLAPVLTGALTGAIPQADDSVLKTSINLSLVEVNQTIFNQAQGNPVWKGMGATAVVAIIWNDRIQIGHIGDCRAYLYHQDKVTQITRDQTLVARMLELGQLTPREAENHPRANEVSQALGKRADIEPAAYQLTLERNDWLILACDGLHAHVNAPTMQEKIRQAPAAANQLARQLVEMANQGGGSDNCTVITVHWN